MSSTIDFAARKPLPVWVHDALTAPGPQWLIDQLIPAEGLTVIAGRPKLSKKSWLAMLASMVMASGRRAAGMHAPERVPVLYLSLEGTPTATAERFKMLEAGHGIPLSECHDMYFSLNAPFQLDQQADVTELCNYVKRIGIKCVVIDTFARAFCGDENSSQDVGAAMRGCARITALGCAVVLVHHLRKEGNSKSAVDSFFDPDSGMRGSSALSGALDILISIKSVPNPMHTSYDTYYVVGGKTKAYVAREVNWNIDGTVAKLHMHPEEELETVCERLKEQSQ